MFAARCLGVSLSVFLLLYISLSTLVVVLGRWWNRRRSQRWVSPNLLFGFRMFPLAFSFAVTVLFAIPSFLVLEPRSTGESIGLDPATLGVACILLLVVSSRRVLQTIQSSARTLARWVGGSLPQRAIDGVPVFRTDHTGPALAVAGLLEPKVLLSDELAAQLTASELQAALRHEMAHVRSYDNLKKLAMRFAAFPGMHALEERWRESAELVADDAAVRNATEAMDLASALIKVSRILPAKELSYQLQTPLLHSSTALEVRFQRLMSWDERVMVRQSGNARLCVLAAGLLSILTIAYTYGSCLTALHDFTEWLVR